MDYQQVLEKVYQEANQLLGMGKVADYIPALASVNPNQLGIAIETIDGQSFSLGDVDVPFSIQSISKVFTLSLVLPILQKELWKRVDREPSGTPFNSLVLLENEAGIPRNPFINAGALVITDCMLDHFQQPLIDLLSFARELSNNHQVNYDSIIAFSEQEHGYRNRAVASFMRSFGNIHNDIERVTDIYCHQCSLMMSCRDLAKSFLYLANGGINPFSNKQVMTKSQARRVNALMMTCGLYDESGEFAYSVGLPGKSGVGGGIVAIVPGELSICCWSPCLNEHGNSLVAMKALEVFAEETGLSVF